MRPRWKRRRAALKGEGGRRVAEHEGVFIRKFDRNEGLVLVGRGHGRVPLRRPVDGRVERGHQHVGVHYGSGLCSLCSLVDRGLLAHLSIRVHHQERQLDGFCRYDILGDRPRRGRYCGQGDWAIAAGKCRIEEEGGCSVVLGLSCRSHGTSPCSPMRSGTASKVRHRSDSQLQGLPRSSSVSRFRT